MSGKKVLYDDDDFYDEHDAEEDYYGDYGDFDPGESQLVGKQSNKTPVKALSKNATKSKANAGTKPQTQAAAPAAAKSKKLQATYPLSPAAPNAEEVSRFKFDTVSPDEAVLEAQKRVTGSAEPSAVHQQQQRSTLQSTRDEATPPVTHDMEKLHIQSATPANARAPSSAGSSRPVSASKQQRHPLEEYHLERDLQSACDTLQAAEQTQPKLHLVVLGHVDAGKSTLMGRLLHDLGYVSQKTVHKHEKEAAQAGKASFSWAWLLDERPEERARGVTVDVATTRFQTAQRNVTLLDAPGHRDFVPNMIAGAAQADAALLLVDGSPGGFESGFDGSAGGGGQTREHAQLARSLGIEQLAVVVSKLDTCSFSERRFLDIKTVLLPFLKGCGFRPSSLQWLPAVGPTGQNLTQPPTEKQLSWFKGPSVVQAIDAFKPSERATNKPFRMPITDVFKGQRGGLSVGGKLEGGAVAVGTAVRVMPSNEMGAVRSIQVDGEAVSLARAGDSADLTLAGVEATVLNGGAVLCHPEWPVPLVTRVMTRLLILDVSRPVLRGQQVTLHAHASQETGHISHLVSLLDAKTFEVSKAKPRCLLQGQSAIVEVTLSRAVCLELYKDYRALGRIALRDSGRTIAVGTVTEFVS
ncbi:hypothetical protein ABBQ38_005186 [Trebouxia sp. C0009 RCD-2024]